MFGIYYNTSSIPITYAASYGHVDVINVLLDLDVNVNASGFFHALLFTKLLLMDTVELCHIFCSEAQTAK